MNAFTLRDMYMSSYKMKFPSASDLIRLIQETGKGCFPYSYYISRAYTQLSLDPYDWPFVCL